LSESNRKITFFIVVPLIITAVYWSELYVDPYAPFGLLGVLGAIFANATGAGGGVVFIPAFQQLGISESQAIATSFGIQCFGMTTGAIMWRRYAAKSRLQEVDWQLLYPLVKFAVIPSVLGVWTIYGLGINSPASLSLLFAVFSILLGVALLLVACRKKAPSELVTLSKTLPSLDITFLMLIGYLGGVITAWLSVGVGEFIAFYLIFRGYRVRLAIAVAVIISAITVWIGIGHHLMADAINWQILMFAGPGAIVGAVIARYLAVWLPAIKLKVFFASWILLAGSIELITV